MSIKQQLMGLNWNMEKLERVMAAHNKYIVAPDEPIYDTWGIAPVPGDEDYERLTRKPIVGWKEGLAKYRKKDKTEDNFTMKIGEVTITKKTKKTKKKINPFNTRTQRKIRHHSFFKKCFPEIRKLRPKRKKINKLRVQRNMEKEKRYLSARTDYEVFIDELKLRGHLPQSDDWIDGDLEDDERWEYDEETDGYTFIGTPA